MDMVRGYHVIKDAGLKPLFGFEQPAQPAISVFHEFEEEFLLVAAMRNVPYLARKVMSISPGHRSTMEDQMEDHFVRMTLR